MQVVQVPARDPDFGRSRCAYERCRERQRQQSDPHPSLLLPVAATVHQRSRQKYARGIVCGGVNPLTAVDGGLSLQPEGRRDRQRSQPSPHARRRSLRSSGRRRSRAAVPPLNSCQRRTITRRTSDRARSAAPGVRSSRSDQGGAEPPNGSSTMSRLLLELRIARSTSATGFMVGWRSFFAGLSKNQTSPWSRAPHHYLGDTGRPLRDGRHGQRRKSELPEQGSPHEAGTSGKPVNTPP